ncbi:MAG: hypothetical protein ACI9US_003748 [Gammaproteobacteria bacterium]|jgi:hypothetical protein
MHNRSIYIGRLRHLLAEPIVVDKLTKRQKGMCMETSRTPIKCQNASLFLLAFLGYSVNITHANECLTFCANSSDYQDPASFLHFSRSHYPSETLSTNAKESPTNGNWRHRYDIVITQDGPQTTIFDHLGSRHTFNTNEDGQYISLSAVDGALSLKNGEFQWMSNDGVQHQFKGSFLTEITSPNNETLRLQYTQQRLVSISNAQGDSIDLNYQNNSITSLTTPQGTTVELANHTCVPQSAPHPETCDTDQHPLASFNSEPAQSGVSTLDARPASCESYFIEYFGTTRGSEIEQALATLPPYQHMQTTVRSFPIVDFVNNTEWIVLRSRDLANPSFNDEETPNALFYRLMRDGREIQDRFLAPMEENVFVTAEEQGLTTTLETGIEPQQLVLQLVIRHQIASPSHWQQIARARELLTQRYDIQLEVVIIP